MVYLSQGVWDDVHIYKKIFNKNHATIIHGVKKVEDELYLYRKFDNKTITMVYLEKVCAIMGMQIHKLD